MPYYRVCPHCGANLDPGEKCGCKDAERIKQYRELIKGAVEKVSDAGVMQSVYLTMKAYIDKEQLNSR